MIDVLALVLSASSKLLRSHTRSRDAGASDCRSSMTELVTSQFNLVAGGDDGCVSGPRGGWGLPQVSSLTA